MKARCTRSRNQRNDGVVLFVVVIVVALVSLAAYGFVILMQSEHRAANLTADQIQVDQIAESGNSYLRAFTTQSRAQRDFLGGSYDNPVQFQDIIVDLDVSGTRHGRFSVIRARTQDGQAIGGPQFGVDNASAKLSLAALLQWDSQFPGAGRTALMQLPGMNETLADSLLDWIDADDVRREFGAESEFYLGLDPPRQPLNRVPSLLADLLDVHALSDATMTSEDTATGTAMNTVDTKTSVAAQPIRSDDTDYGSGQAGSGSLPWLRLLTPHSAERNESYAGQPRINLNQSDLSDLYNELSTRFDDELAKFVVAVRLHGLASSDSANTATTAIPKIDLSEKPTYEFTSPLEVIGAMVSIPTSSGEEESTEVFESPLSDRGGEAKVIDFCDQTTTFDQPVIVGRININRAPREVLLTIPQFPREAIEQLISARGSQAEFPERRHAAWLLVEGVLDRETLIPLMPYITTGGDVIEAEVVAYYDDDSPWSRHRIVLDGTKPGVPTLCFRDLSRLGRGHRFDQLSRQDPNTLASPPDIATAPTTAFNNQ